MRTCRHCKTRFDETASPETLRRCPSLAAVGRDGPCEGVPRGFATMDKGRLSVIAARGGKVAHALGHAHQWKSEEAQVAGRAGGTAPHTKRGPDPLENPKRKRKAS